MPCLVGYDEHMEGDEAPVRDTAAGGGRTEVNGKDEGRSEDAGKTGEELGAGGVEGEESEYEDDEGGDNYSELSSGSEV